MRKHLRVLGFVDTFCGYRRNGLITILAAVPDPRTGNAQRHDLLKVLTIAPVAAICGCQTYVDMADFARSGRRCSGRPCA